MPGPRVAVIGTGGTISSVGKHAGSRPSREQQDLRSRRTVKCISRDAGTRRCRPVRLRDAEYGDWPCGVARDQHENPRPRGRRPEFGRYCRHAWNCNAGEDRVFPKFGIKVEIPIVLVGAQRPAAGIPGINLVNAIRTAGHPSSGRGVLGVLNDEIHFSRDMTKTSTLRQQTFKSPDFGLLGHADWDKIAYYRMPERPARQIPNSMCAA